METKQKQVIEAYLRVRAFLERYPAPAPTSYAEPKAQLEDVIAQLTDHSTEQKRGREKGTAEFRRQKRLVQVLRDHHLRPIVTIARASMTDQPGIEAALRLPPINTALLKILAAADAIRKLAADYEPVFVKNGRPADFLQQLDAAIAAVRASIDVRAEEAGRHIGAKAGLKQELVRGRRAVDMLDAIVRVAFERSEDVLAEWVAAKKIQGARVQTADKPAAAQPANPAPKAA